MKRIFSIFTILAITVVGFSACDDEDVDNLGLSELLLLATLLDQRQTCRTPPPGALPFHQPSTANLRPGIDYVEGEVLVQFEEDISGPQALSIMSSVSSALPRSAYQSNPGTAHFHVLKLNQGLQVQSALSSLHSRQGVRHVQPNYIRRAAAAPDTDSIEYFEYLWGLENTGQTLQGFSSTSITGIAGKDMNVVPAWNQENSASCADVIVAVIDSGVDHQHKNLANNMWNGSGGCKNPDGSSRVGGCPNHGWNFTDEGPENDPQDSNQVPHGTHVAGTIGMAEDVVGPDDGGIGVCGDVQLMAIKSLGDEGGTDATVINGIDFAIQNGAHIINMSLGGTGGSNGDAFYQAIERARDANILVLAAAGNEGTDNDVGPSFPANYSVDNIIAVGAGTPRGQLASFSQYGERCVEVAAPGSFIFSTVREGIGMEGYDDPNLGSSDPDSLNYSTIQGTSMATPHVAGLAAFLKQRNLACSYSGIRNAILNGARTETGLNGQIQQNRWADMKGSLDILTQSCN